MHKAMCLQIYSGTILPLLHPSQVIKCLLCTSQIVRNISEEKEKKL